MLIREHRVYTLGSVENDVDLSAKAGLNTAQRGSLNATFLNTANKGSSGTGTPATRTGTSWRGGSICCWKNSATVGGATGSTGPTGSSGGQGSGGAGGNGGPAGNPGSNGSSGGTGGTGGTGSTGGTGGPSFTADAVSGLRILVDNGPGTLNGGTGGPGGPGGSGGPGGGGGGGGGGA